MKIFTHVLGFQKKTPRGTISREILPHWQSALKWGLGEVQPGSTPSGPTDELPPPVLPGFPGVRTPGAPSVQIQQLLYKPLGLQ